MTALVHAADSRRAADGLEMALLRFLADGSDALRDELLRPQAGDAHDPSTSSGLDAVCELTELLAQHADADAFALADDDALTSLAAVVKALCKTASAYISSVASSPTEEVAAFLRLDANAAPIFAFLAAFTDFMHSRKAQRGPCGPKELLRWVPFVLHACAHVACARLPAAESMVAFAHVERILGQCEAITDSSSRPELLAKYIEQLVALCSQSVSKDEWVDRHSFPKHVLRWIALQVPSPHLGGDLLGRLLALVFPLIDDLSDASQLVGAQLLQHVVRSVTATELRWYADVLVEVLRVAITSRTAETIDVLLDCLTASLDKLSPPGDYALYDKFFPRLLNDTSLCSDVVIRAIFLRRLRPMIARMGAPHSVHVIRYLQPLLKVLVASFEGINMVLLLETLETLRVTILSAWPRVPAHTEEIFVGVMRAVAFCEVFDAGAMQLPVADEERAQLRARCAHIFVLLHDLTQREQSAGSGEVASGRVEQQGDSLVLGMLRKVAASCAPLAPFCERMAATLVKDA